MSESCPVDAKNGEKRLSDWPESPPQESPPSSIEVLAKLAAAMDQQNSLLVELINQNAVLIGNLADRDEPADPEFDMAGNRIQVS